MRTFLPAFALFLVGCGASTDAPSGSNPTDGGTTGDTSDNPCFGDGWCTELTGKGTLKDVWASGPNDVWVVGDDRMVHRFDGTRWTSSSVPGEGAGVSVFGRGPNDVFVGIENGVQHWDGKGWSAEPITPPSTLLRFAVDDAGNVWARTGNSGVYRREGTSWVAVLPDKTVDLLGASILSCDAKVWLAAGLMAEWDGKTFWMHGVSSNDDSVRAAGTYGTKNAWVSSRYLRRSTGGPFRANLLEGAPRGLFAMSVASETEAWALGEGPLLASWDGSKWKTHPTIDTKDIISLSWVKPGVVRLMQKNGAILEWEVATATKKIVAEVAWLTLPGPYPSVTWVSPAEAYYNEGGKMWHWVEGTLKWSNAGSTDDATRRIWAESATSVWTVGQRIRRWNGSTMSEVSTGIPLDTGETLLDVGGSGGSDVWVVTSKRNLHFDGTTWKAFASGFAESSTVARVASFGPSDAWVFRDQGRFAHFDGTSFRAEPDAPTIDWAGCVGGGQLLAVSQNPTTILRGAPLSMTRVADTAADYRAIDVWFGASGTAWLLGDNASARNITFFDGKTMRVSVDATGRSFQAIWALESGEAWAVGTSGIVHRKPS